MNTAGGWLAVILVGAYALFEITHLKRFSYRMEPGYVLDEFVRADRAVTLCGAPPADERTRFLHNLGVVRERALAALQEADPSLASAAAEQALAQQIQHTADTVDAAVREKGCEDIQLWRWQKLHTQRARLNLHTPKA